MNKSALIEILNSFSPKEMKEFGEYIRSPFFNKNKVMVTLFEAVKASVKSGNPSKLEKEYVYKKLFKGEAYNDGTMRTLMLNLARLAEGFLIQVNISDELSSTKLLVNELNNRNLKKNFQKSIKQLEELVEGSDSSLFTHYYNRYVVSGEKDIFNSRERRQLNIKDMPDDSLLGQSDNVSLFFLLVYMDRSKYLLNRGYITKEDVGLELLENMITRLSAKYIKHAPLLIFKYNILSLLVYEREEDFFKLKSFINENGSSLDKDELFNCAVLMQNFCNNKYHRGDHNFLKESHDIEKILIKDNAVVPPASLYHTPVRYKNAVIIALKLKEYDWVESYIEEFKEKLSPEHMESAYNYCSARVEFDRGNFQNALEKLSRVQNEDIYYKMEIKVFLLKIYYELGMEDQAIDLGNTFRQFLAKNKLITEMHIQTSSNFIKLINRLFKVKNIDDQGEKGFLLNEIKNTTPLVGKDWLIEKAEELANPVKQKV